MSAVALMMSRFFEKSYTGLFASALFETFAEINAAYPSQVCTFSDVTPLFTAFV